MDRRQRQRCIRDSYEAGKYSVFCYDLSGNKIGSENKAYAIAFYLQDQEKTLNDKQIDKIMSKLMYRFENELNAVIRK